jgi:hypothetical protein
MSHTKQNRDNRANQLNPNNDAYWKSRGEPGKPPAEQPPAQPSESPKSHNE